MTMRIYALTRWIFTAIGMTGLLPLLLPGETPEISLRSSGDLIINPELRETALEVGRREIASGETGFLETLEGVKSPFLPLDFAENKEEEEEEVAEKAEDQVNYTDEAILQAVASRFSKEVRGSLGRGAVNYLQVEGGSLVRPGTSFPATIPQIAGQTFEITVESISPEAYVLVLGEARVRLTYDRAETGSGRIQFSD